MKTVRVDPLDGKRMKKYEEEAKIAKLVGAMQNSRDEISYDLHALKRVKDMGARKIIIENGFEVDIDELIETKRFDVETLTIRIRDKIQGLRRVK